VPLDEYENYAPQIASLLERGADVDGVAKALSEIRTGSIGDEPDTARNRATALKVVQWFETGAHPGFESGRHDDL